MSVKTIPSERHDEFVESYVFLNSIKEALGVVTGKAALEKVRQLVQEAA